MELEFRSQTFGILPVNDMEVGCMTSDTSTLTFHLLLCLLSVLSHNSRYVLMFIDYLQYL